MRKCHRILLLFPVISRRIKSRNYFLTFCLRSALRPNNDDGDEAPALVGAGDSEDVPMLIDDDLNFEQVAQLDEDDGKKTDDKDQESGNADKPIDDAANAEDSKKDNDEETAESKPDAQESNVDDAPPAESQWVDEPSADAPSVEAETET